jgi:hypothetical protein
MKGDFSRWSFNPAKHYHGVLKQQGRVDLDADFNEQNAITAHRIEEEAVDVIGACGAPIGDPGFQIALLGGGTGLSISKGRAYVDGILCENEQDNLPITQQPDYPNFPFPSQASQAGIYIAYLRVWLRHITFLDDPAIREEALGGPDTCTRARTVWQVGLVSAGEVGSGITCSTDVPALDTLMAPSSGTLQAQAQPTTTTTTPCAISATAGYTSLENQLYRVEIHDGGDISGNNVTFKWSRENGSIVTSWTGQDATGDNLTVTSVGPDSVLGFAAGQWVELTDDTHELNFQPGSLVPLSNVEGLTLTINPPNPSPPTNISNFPLNPKIRRWDSAGLAKASAGGWITLENGVQIQFGSGTYTAGDYWLIPARALTGNIDWPVDNTGNPIARPPVGIQRHYCRLAVVQFDGTVWSLIANCLPIFPPLTGIQQKSKGIHVTDVKYLLRNKLTELANDSSVELELLIGGERGLPIQIFFDAPIDPVSARPATCFVTVELPYPFDVLHAVNPKATGTGNVIGYQPLVLPATVSAKGGSGVNEITLVVPVFTMSQLNQLLRGSLTSRFLTRITLKGKFLWGRADPTLYLDGAAFGVTRTDPDGPRIGLILPGTGDGTPGSDFEMWFWLTRPVIPQSVTLDSTTGHAGMITQGLVNLDGYAPPGGTRITLSSSTTSVTISPTRLIIPEGQLASSFFGVTVGAKTAPGKYTITATASTGTANSPLTITSA